MLQPARGDFARQRGVQVALPPKKEKKTCRSRAIARKRTKPPHPPRRRFSCWQLRDPHGPAVFARRRRSARLSILESRRSAKNSLRRYRLDLWRTFRRASRSRHRPEGPHGCHGARHRIAFASAASQGEGTLFAIDNHAEPALGHAALSIERRFHRCRRRTVPGRRLKNFLVARSSSRASVAATSTPPPKSLRLHAVALPPRPRQNASGPRCAHRLPCTPGSARKTEGWWRLALDELQIPYDYISTQKIAKFRISTPIRCDLVSSPVGWNSSVPLRSFEGLPMAWGNPLALAEHAANAKSCRQK